jgi:phospholipid/cholesterol/gamma-HCH transport system substrate-binding protein
MKVSKELKVGVFMVVSLVLLYFGFNYLKGIDFLSSTNKYYAIYDNVDKLSPSNQIYINGYSVGRVSRIQFEQSRNRVIVEMEINSDIVLGDSTVAMLNGDILGTKFIQLYVGNLATPLQPKDTVRSAVAKGIADFLAESAVPVADNLQMTLRKLNTILDNLSRNTEKLDVIFAGLKDTPKMLNNTLANTNSKIDALSGSVTTVTDNLNGAISDLRPAINNFKTLSDSLKSVELNATLKKAQKALDNLNQTLARLGKGDNTMSKLMTEDTLYVNLNKLLQSLDTLATHFNENPKHFMAPLGKNRDYIKRDLKKQQADKK